jgi:hypothetical protein
MMTDELRTQRPVGRFEFEEQDENLIRVVIPRFGNGTLGRIMQKIAIRTEDKLNLDELGSFVYRHCDGTRTVREIAVQLREHFGEKAEPAEDRLALFIREMVQRELILFAPHD